MRLDIEDEELNCLKWLLDSELRVQWMIVQPDPETVKVLESLQDKVNWLVEP